jgi:hypothetical protein
MQATAASRHRSGTGDVERHDDRIPSVASCGSLARIAAAHDSAT